MVTVAVGDEIVCGTDEAHTMTCWLDEATVVAEMNLDSVASASVSLEGTVCTVGLDRSLECHWDELYDQISSAPDGDFSFVDSFGHFTCAINVSGEIDCWGQVQPSDGSTAWDAIHAAPEGPFTALSTGFYHSCAFHESIETLQCWGDAPPETLTVPDVFE